MFQSFALNLARDQCIAIARERTAHLTSEGKALALELISVTLNCWKLEQADSEGLIEQQLPIAGLLGMTIHTPTLGDLAMGETSKRVPVAALEPWQCGGFGVNCDADLFSHLAFGVGYAPAKEAERTLGPCVSVALLLERDGMKMPADSIASAVRHLWIAVWFALEVYRENARKQGEKEAAAIEQQSAASALGAAKTRQEAERRKAEWRAIAAGIWREDPKAKRAVVALMVLDELRKRGNAELPSSFTIEDALKGFRDIVLVGLARSARRETPE